MDNPQEGLVFRPTLWYNDTMSEEYIAGLIDGEGYLGIIPVKRNDTVNPCYSPAIKIALTGETGEQALQPIKNRFGGYLKTRRRLTKGGRVVHTYEIYGKKSVRTLLLAIKPHLIVKQAQAKLLLEYTELPAIHPKYNNFDQSLLDRKQELYREMKKLKQPLATTE